MSDIDLFGRIFSRNDTYGLSGYTVNPCNFVSVVFNKLPLSGTGWEIFSNDFKMQVSDSEFRVGAAFVVSKNGLLVDFGIFRLADLNSVFDGELYAILQALLWVPRNIFARGKLRLFSDSLSSLLMIRNVTS